MNVQDIVNELNSLDPKQPGAWPRYVHFAVAVVVTVVIAVGGYFYFIVDELDNLARVQQQEEGLKNEFETKQRKVAALDALKEQLAEMERSFGAMLRVLPSKAEIANLLIDISQTRLAASLEEELFQPQGEAPKEFYAEVPNRITVVGSYHELGTFVSGTAALPRIVTIENVDIKPVGGTSRKVRMSAVLKTYRYLDEGEIQAAQPAPGRGGRR
jgi:type IV pilus assembly protein PilO